MGLDVISMEAIDVPPDDPFQWSMDGVSRSDIYILLIGGCGGSLAYGGIGLEGMGTFTHWELKASRHHTVRQFHYRIHRPFSDTHLLELNSKESQEYHQTLGMQDANYWFPEYILTIGRKIDDVYSVAELLEKVTADLQRSLWRVYLRRLSPRWLLSKGHRVRKHGAL